MSVACRNIGKKKAPGGAFWDSCGSVGSFDPVHQFVEQLVAGECAQLVAAVFAVESSGPLGLITVRAVRDVVSHAG